MNGYNTSSGSEIRNAIRSALPEVIDRSERVANPKHRQTPSLPLACLSLCLVFVLTNTTPAAPCRHAAVQQFSLHKPNDLRYTGS